MYPAIAKIFNLLVGKLMRKIKILFALMFCISMPLTVAADSRALSYQDCILEVVSDGLLSSQRDIGRVKELCEERFPDSAPKVIGEKIDAKALEKIDIYTNRGSDGVINGSVYNGNGHIILTRLEILLTPKTHQGSVMDFFDSEEYQINLLIKPFATEHFTIEPDKTSIDGQFSWKLVRAWGR